MYPTTLRLVAATLVAVSLSFTASAQLDVPQFFLEAPAAGDPPPADRAATRGRVVRLQTDLLTSADRQPQLMLSLFPDAVFRAAFASMEVVRPGQTVWRARLEGIEDGEATLAITDGAVAGQVTMPGAQYRIRYLGAGLHAVEQLDTSRLPRESEPLVPEPSQLAEPEAVSGQVPDDGSIIDVMVVFTPAARAAAGGPAGMTSLVNLAVGNSNNSYANSGVTQRLRLVYSGEVSYSENSFDMQTDLKRLTNTADGFLDQVHTLRNTYRADFVALLTDAADYCGMAWLMQTVSPNFQTSAFSVTSWSCAGANLSFAHELGHNMGLHHDFANAGGGQGAYPYAYGYQAPGYFRTVMAYACAGNSCPRVQHFSTPTRTYGGRPTGVVNASENVRALNNTAPTTANFRVGVVCTFTVSPTSGNTPIGGGTGTVLITASDSSCAWNAASNSSFISVSPTSGSGSGSVTYTVTASGAANTRSGSLTIAGRTVLVFQAGYSRNLATDFNGDGVEEVGIFRPLEGRFYVNGRPSVDWGAAADIPVPGDYTGDRIADYAVWRPANGTWYISGVGSVEWGAAGDIPVPGDYNADGVTDKAVFRPSTGQWFIRDIGTFVWGVSGDLPVASDFDGDGATDVAVWRPATGTWYIRNGATVVWGKAGDVPMPADFDGNGTTDVAVWRPGTGTWYVRNQFTRVWGALGDVPVALDRNGDGRTELGLFRASTNSWYLLNSSTSAIETIVYGKVGDIPLGRPPALQSRRGDYDGDRRADLTVFRPSNGKWLSLRTLSGMADHTARDFGTNGDVPVAGDWDGDGINDPAVYRPSTHTWYAQRSSTNYTDYVSRNWGLSGDIPVPADYDGDRRMDFAVFRPSIGRWVILLSSTGNTSYALSDFGLSGDIPVPGDYDGDMRADIAVFRPSTGVWYILNRFTGAFITFDWGLTGDKPVQGDYDGDGRLDIAVYRPSTGRWLIRLSSNGFAGYVSYDFGLSTDTVVPADYDGDGRTEIAIFRPSTGRWYILNRFLGTYTYRDWGLSGDLPATKLPF